jgi:hypothetical protein
MNAMVSAGNWHSHRLKINKTFGDHMREKWNNPKHPRGPYQYFSSSLFPVGIDKNTGDLVYKYRDWHKGDTTNNIIEENSD